MDIDMILKMRDMLIEDEGFREKPYVDTEGKTTIGIGYNLTDRGLPKEIIYSLCTQDISECNSILSKNLWYQVMNEPRKIAMINMIYNLGSSRFHSFKKMIDALNQKNYQKASDEMLDSKWAKQVGKRANRLATILISGELPDQYN